MRVMLQSSTRVCVCAVSYTHLDVYKRQYIYRLSDTTTFFMLKQSYFSVIFKRTYFATAGKMSKYNI